MVGLVGCAVSVAAIGWIPRVLLRMVEDADPMLLGEVWDSFPLGKDEPPS